MSKKEKKYRELNELKGLMRQEHVTQADLAHQIGMCENAMVNKLNGYSVFNTIEILKIMNALEADINNIQYYFF